MREKPIFDAHLHIFLKSILTGYRMGFNFNGTDPWSSLNIGFPASLMGKTLRSQSNLVQIKEANASLVVHALFSPDYSLIDAGLVDKLGPFIIKDLKKKAIQRLKNNTPKDNLLFELECVEFVKNNIPQGQPNINCLTSLSSYDSKKINLVFNIEGAHNFYNQTESGAHYFDKTFLNTLKEDINHRICFVNLTHVQQWWLCTHAYAMKLLDNCLSNKTIRYMFKPSGYGIQNEGFDVIRQMLDNTNGQRMLVDVKHMSLFSRIQYYAWRRKHFKNVPIVASHVGLTGRSWYYIKNGKWMARKKKKFQSYRVSHKMDKYKGHLKDTNFYPNTINLYNEEIIEIVKSGGLIGISLDKRILGSQSELGIDDTRYSYEFLSNEEYHLLLGAETSILEKISDDDYILDRDKINQDYGIGSEEGESIRPSVADFINTNYAPNIKSRGITPLEPIEEEEEIILNTQVEHFINTLLHIVMVGGVEAWNCICIGSDFDGLITPIKKIKTISDLPKLRSNVTFFVKNNPNLWTAFNVNGYEDIETKIQNLFFENGKRFVESIL